MGLLGLFRGFAGAGHAVESRAGVGAVGESAGIGLVGSGGITGAEQGEAFGFGNGADVARGLAVAELLFVVLSVREELFGAGEVVLSGGDGGAEFERT